MTENSIRQDEDEQVRALMLLARGVANSYSARLPRRIDRSEIYAAALRGVWNAVRLFRPERNGNLAMYAQHKARWEIINYLRDYEPGFARANRRRKQSYISLDLARHGDGSLAEMLPDENAGGGIKDFINADLIRWACCSLPPREKAVICECFLHGRIQADVAKDLGVSEALISRIQARALGFLRERMLIFAERDNKGRHRDH